MRPIVFFILLSACSKGPMGPCKDRSGTFSVTFSERSGNCGQLPEQIVVISGKTMSMGSCVGPVQVSTDNCDVQLDLKCSDGSGLRGTVSWDQDGRNASGVIQLTGKAGACSSSYDVSYKRVN